MSYGNRITWQNITAPDFTAAVRAQESAATAMDRAFNRISTGIDNFDNYRKDTADTAYLKNMLAFQDPKALQEAMATGQLMQGVNPEHVRAATMMKAQNQVGTLLENATKQQAFDHNAVMNPQLQQTQTLANEQTRQNIDHRAALNPLELVGKQQSNAGELLTNKQAEFNFNNSVETAETLKAAQRLYQTALANGTLADKAGANRYIQQVASGSPAIAAQLVKMMQQHDPSFGAPLYAQQGVQQGSAGNVGATGAAGAAGAISAAAGTSAATPGMPGFGPSASLVRPKFTKTATGGYVPEGVSEYTRDETRAPSIQDLRTRASQLGVDPNLAMAIFHQESSGNWEVGPSSKNAQGGMQVIPGTFKEMMGSKGDIKNPWDNMEAGLRYLANVSEVTGSTDPRIIAAGYHSGPNRADLKMGFINPNLHDGADGAVGKYTKDYVNDIVKRYAKLSENPSVKATSLPGVDTLDVENSRSKVQSGLAAATAGTWQVRALEALSKNNVKDQDTVVAELTNPGDKGKGAGPWAGIDPAVIRRKLNDIKARTGKDNDEFAAEILKGTRSGADEQGWFGRLATGLVKGLTGKSSFNEDAITAKINYIVENGGKALEDGIVSAETIKLNQSKQKAVDTELQAKKQALIVARTLLDNNEPGAEPIYLKAQKEYNEAEEAARSTKSKSTEVLRNVNGTKAPPSAKMDAFDQLPVNASIQDVQNKRTAIKQQISQIQEESLKLFKEGRYKNAATIRENASRIRELQTEFKKLRSYG